jgi:hypothetical protein
MSSQWWRYYVRGLLLTTKTPDHMMIPLPPYYVHTSIAYRL